MDKTDKFPSLEEKGLSLAASKPNPKPKRVDEHKVEQFVSSITLFELHYKFLYFLNRSTSILSSAIAGVGSDLVQSISIDDDSEASVMQTYSDNVNRSLAFSLLLMFKASIRFEEIRNFLFFSKNALVSFTWLKVITPAITINGITGKIKRSCLFGNDE